MADSVELATAYITLVPSMQGAETSITDSLVGAASQGGAGAGSAAAGAFGAKWKAGIAGLAIGAGVVKLFQGLWDVAETFDDIEDTIRVGTGATGEALDSLVASAEQVGRTVPAEFTEVGQVVADVNTRLGLTGGTLETVASQYLEAGRILGETVDINATSAAFNAFGIAGDGVSSALDTLFQVSQATGVGMNELASAVQANAPAVQALGFSFEETVALVGSLDKAGLNSTQVMSAMSRALVNLAKDGEEPVQAFARVVGQIEDYIAAGDTAAAVDLAGQVFGTRGATQLVGAIESGTLALDDLIATAGATNDTILGVGEETQDFAETWQLVKNNAMAALEPLASSVFTGVGDALKAAMPYLESFAGWLSENQWVLGVVAGLIGVTLVAAFIAWTASIWASTIALLANPITWIVIAVVALAAALIWLLLNWDAVAEWLTTTWNSALTWASETLGNFGDNVREFFAGLPDRIVGWLGDLGDLLIGAGRAVIDGFLSGLSSGWNGVVSFVTGLAPWIAENKGPLSYDRRLLEPAGEAIMGGLDRSMRSRLGALRGTLGEITATIAGHHFGPAAVGAGGAGAGGAGGLTIQNYGVDANELAAKTRAEMRDWAEGQAVAYR